MINKIIYQDDKVLKFLIISKKYGNKEVVIDSEDWNKINYFKWHVNYSPHIKNFYCITNKKDKKHLKLHRLILDIVDSKIIIDHINHNTLDNQKKNLRICTPAENSKNMKMPKNNISGYKGVSWHKASNKWQSHIRINNIEIYLGLYNNKLQAAKAYNKAAIKYSGEFACLNKI